jgi:hypothetical protein
VAVLDIDPSLVHVRFTRTEKVLGLIRDFAFLRDAIAGVDLEDNGIALVEGLRAPGLSLPGRRRLGTWRSPGRRAAVSVVTGERTIRVMLIGQEFDEVVISSRHAPTWADELRDRH